MALHGVPEHLNLQNATLTSKARVLGPAGERHIQTFPHGWPKS